MRRALSFTCIGFQPKGFSPEAPSLADGYVRLEVGTVSGRAVVRTTR